MGILRRPGDLVLQYQRARRCLHVSRQRMKPELRSSIHMILQQASSVSNTNHGWILEPRDWKRPLRGDLIAGLSVAIVLIPQALAYAEIAGLPAYIGLYAAALPALAAAALASSRYLQTGPTAMTALLTFGAASRLAVPGTDEYVEVAIVLALIVGVVRLGLGLVRGGVVAHLMSSPALIGFAAAAAILILASQLPTALGVGGGDGSLLGDGWRALRAVGSWDWAAVLMAAGTVIVLLVGPAIHRRFPGVLLVMVAGILISEMAGYEGAVIGSVPVGLPALSLSFRFEHFWRLVVPGAVIALLGFAEVTAISRTFATQDRERWDPSREFISQGVANVVAAISGGFPVGGSFSRSSIARLAGAHTRWAGAITGLTVLAFLPFADVISSLPRAVLAAIVIVAVVRLVRLRTMTRLIGQTWGQAFVAWATFVATLALSPRIELGVIVGVALAAAVHLRRETLIRVSTEKEDGVLILRPSGVLFYGSAARLDETFATELAAHPEIESVVVDLEGLGRIDYTGALALKEFLDDAAAAGLETAVRDIPKHAEGTLNRSWGDDHTHLRWEG